MTKEEKFSKGHKLKVLQKGWALIGKRERTRTGSPQNGEIMQQEEVNSKKKKGDAATCSAGFRRASGHGGSGKIFSSNERGEDSTTRGGTKGIIRKERAKENTIYVSAPRDVNPYSGPLRRKSGNWKSRAGQSTVPL